MSHLTRVQHDRDDKDAGRDKVKIKLDGFQGGLLIFSQESRTKNYGFNCGINEYKSELYSIDGGRCDVVEGRV